MPKAIFIGARAFLRGAEQIHNYQPVSRQYKKISDRNEREEAKVIMADSKKRLLTYAGLKALEDELENLKVVKRKEVAAKIREAREQGDLSENAEYDAAKEEQAQIEAEIREMEDILLNCKIIDKPTNEGEVSIGSTVTVYDEEFDENLVLQILGSTESNPAKGIISNNSPVGSALRGKKIGERVTIKLDSGDITYKIVDVKHNF